MRPDPDAESRLVGGDARILSPRTPPSPEQLAWLERLRGRLANRPRRSLARPLAPPSALRPIDLAAAPPSRTDRSGPSDPTIAGVLAPLFLNESGDLWLWLLRKVDTLRRHAGQVALPGGKHEEGDESLVATALREAEEEIGLPRSATEMVGAFDDYLTTTGYLVSPHVVLVVAPFLPVPDPGEVARIFSAPLATFLAPATPHSVHLFGANREVPGYTVDGETVWGATAAILQDLSTVLLG
jgi:8-oxo-dGTP pyrophosphatase MutT (NUDIX family)